jgi:integrase
VPRLERRAAHVPGAAELVADYEAWLVVDGHGSVSYRNAAWSFLARWSNVAAFADESLAVQESLGVAVRPFVTYLMATGRLRPGFDYLTRKIGGLLTQAARGPLAEDISAFIGAASKLDYSEHTVRCAVERVIVRLLIQTGRPLCELTAGDLDELAAALHRRTQVSGKPTAWAADRAMISTAHRVLFHLGILGTPPTDPRVRPNPGGRWDGVAEPLRTVLVDYCTQAAATRAPATVKTIVGHLTDFGRFLSSCDPPVTDLAALDRPTVEAWLATLAAARRRDGNAMSIGYRRGRIIAVRQFLTEITEWGWPAAPARALIFSRDLPRLAHPLPRYLPPDADRALLTALNDLSTTAPAAQTRLHADALLLTRATGLRIGELRDLELDCVHQIDGHGAWLKVPLGKLATERMVPLDEETVEVVDRIVARRTPGRPLPHPRTGRPVDFLLVHQGRRISACALRAELARAADAVGIDKITPHALRHTFATALVNAGCSLQALMQLLGHVSANMSLRYGLFDATVREEYQRALTQTKAQLSAAPASPAAPPTQAPVVGRPLPLVAITGGADWKDTATIKSRLAAGFCLRAPAQGSCSYANICEHCPNFRTDAGYLAVLGAQHADTLALVADAEARGWGTEATRHRRLADRLDELINQSPVEIQ